MAAPAAISARPCRIAAIAIALTLLACRATPAPSPFRVATDAQARAIVEGVLQRAAAGDDGASWTCDRRALFAPEAPPLPRTARVLRVEPAWLGPEPLFLVDVGSDGTDTRTLRLHARAGCLDAAPRIATDIAL